MTKLVILNPNESRRVESANKFSRAVFFANNGELKNGIKEEQEIMVACKTLIHNAIVLWNYLYLSQLLANNSDLEERKNMLKVSMILPNIQPMMVCLTWSEYFH